MKSALSIAALVAATVVPCFARQLPGANECLPDSEALSPHKMKATLQRTVPIAPPCCAHKLHVKGTLVFEISVDTAGEVACAQVVSGHPLMDNVALDSIRHWKFRPYRVEPSRKNFHGRIAIRFRANERVVKYKVIAAP